MMPFKTYVSFLICTAFGLFSCAAPSLEKQILLAARDGEISSGEWESIAAAAQQEGACLNAEGNVDSILLQQYILEVRLQRQPSTAGKAHSNEQQNALGIKHDQQSPIRVKFYLERSGSMIYYDAPSTMGIFKAGVARLLNSIPPAGSEKHLLFIVNSKISLYPNSFTEFIKSKDIFKDTKGLGDPRYTDFACIFDSILVHTGENDLSVLVSDLIYSTKDMSYVNPQKIMNEAQAMTTNIFRQHADKCVIVVKLIADYDGKYYPYNSPNNGIPYRGPRPYYLTIIGSPDVIRRIHSEKPYMGLVQFDQLKGYSDYFCFSPNDIQPYYSVILKERRNRGRMRASKDTIRAIHSLEKVRANRDGKLSITLAVNLNGILAPDSFKCNASNYVVKSQAQYHIESIEKITPEERSPLIEHYAPNATHIIVLTTEQAVQNETVHVTLPKKLPLWVQETNSDDDSNVAETDFGRKTFAFKYLMQGIFDAYNKPGDESNYFTLSIRIKK